MAMLFYISYPFTIVTIYFSLPLKQTKTSFAFKISPLFHFDLLPFGYQPIGPRPSHQTPLAALAREGYRIAAQEACSGPAFLQSVLYVSAAICSAFSPWTRPVLRDTGSLPLWQKLGSQPKRNRVERQGLLRDQLKGNSLSVFESLDKGLSQENNN